MIESGIEKNIKQICRTFDLFIKYLNILDNYVTEYPVCYIVVNWLFLIFTIFLIGISFLLKYALNFNIKQLLYTTNFFNIQLEMAFSLFLFALLLITLCKSYNSLDNPNLLTENVWVKSSLFFMSKLYSLLFIVFLLGIFKSIIYIFAVQENQNKPELYNPALVIIFSIVIFINILLPILLKLYRSFKNNNFKIDDCIVNIFKSLIAISLVGIIAYFICKALQIWVASSILSIVKLIKKTENDNVKTATYIIHFVMVCLIFLSLLAVKCNPNDKFEGGILHRIDRSAYFIQSKLFPKKAEHARTYDGGRRAKKYK